MKKVFVAMMATGLMAGCSAMPEKTAAVEQVVVEKVAMAIPMEAVSLNNEDMFVVYHDGRMNVFYDAKLYKEFLQVGETAYRKTFIGAGPKGETIMYGLTKDDKKKLAGIPSIEMMEGRLDGASEFYGEIRDEGRINVFSDWALFKAYMTNGEVPYRLTDIGAGPKGETVVYALTKDTKKTRPEALIAQFKLFNAS